MYGFEFSNSNRFTLTLPLLEFEIPHNPHEKLDTSHHEGRLLLTLVTFHLHFSLLNCRTNPFPGLDSSKIWIVLQSPCSPSLESLTWSNYFPKGPSCLSASLGGSQSHRVWVKPYNFHASQTSLSFSASSSTIYTSNLGTFYCGQIHHYASAAFPPSVPFNSITFTCNWYMIEMMTLFPIFVELL